MDDIYSVLLGQAPTDSKKQALIAEQLRRRRSFGELGALSGDRVLQSFGQGQQKASDDYVTDLQGTRQKDVDNAQTKSYQDFQAMHAKEIERLTERGQTLDHIYQDSQAKHAKEMERLTERGQTLDHTYQMMMAQAALEKAEKTGAVKPSKLTFSDRNKLETMSGIITNADSSLNTFQDDYAQRLGPGPQSRLPNTAASFGMGSKGSKEASDWWGGWNLIYSLPQRNATFGATLTPTERQAWSESDINPSMDKDQIRKRMKRVVDILKRKGSLMNKTYQKQFDPELIQEYGLPEMDEVAPAPTGHGAPMPQPAAQAQGMAAPTGRIKVDMDGNPL